LVFAVVEDTVVKVNNSEAICQAAWLAGSFITAVYLSHKHWEHFPLAD